MAGSRKARRRAKDVLHYIGYNAMYIDGICEVEEGLFSETIAFSDTSYQSTRDDIQKGIFSSMCRLYDQFGADTLIQMSVINTPIPFRDRKPPVLRPDEAGLCERIRGCGAVQRDLEPEAPPGRIEHQARPLHHLLGGG